MSFSVMSGMIQGVQMANDMMKPLTDVTGHIGYLLQQYMYLNESNVKIITGLVKTNSEWKRVTYELLKVKKCLDAIQSTCNKVDYAYTGTGVGVGISLPSAETETETYLDTKPSPNTDQEILDFTKGLREQISGVNKILEEIMNAQKKLIDTEEKNTMDIDHGIQIFGKIIDHLLNFIEYQKTTHAKVHAQELLDLPEESKDIEIDELKKKINQLEKEGKLKDRIIENQRAVISGHETTMEWKGKMMEPPNYSEKAYGDMKDQCIVS